MKSNYKQLGNYIRQVDVRNRDGKEDNLLGVSNQKKFIPSIANTVGTDFTKYKVVKKNQFSYIPVTSRSGDKVGIALLEDHEEGLVSSFYTVFEVIDRKKLLPQYLMLWFKRAEFDRYARFKSHGSVREVFDWEEMCKVELPIPSYEEQLKIVESYKVITDRIELKKRINDNLFEQIKLLFDQWFIQYDFPNKQGKPYKSSAGELIFNNLLKTEIPKNWNVCKISDICSVVLGGTPRRDCQEYWNGYISWLNSGEVADFPVVTSKEKITQLGVDNSATKLMPKGTTLVSITGNIRTSVLGIDSCGNQSIVGILENKQIKCPYLHQVLMRNIKNYESLSTGSCQLHINKNDVGSTIILLPPDEILEQYYRIAIPIYEKMFSLALENERLKSIRDWLLSVLMNGQTSLN